MKTILTTLAAGMLHLIPALCIGVLAMRSNDPVVAITVAVMFFATIALGYGHGYLKTWVKPKKANVVAFPQNRFPN